MTILIRGMKMPESCYFCRLGDQCLGIMCRIVGVTYANASNRPSSRPSWCPLIEVPTPHGRLINADELITTFCEWGTRLERGRKLVITMCEAKQAIVNIIADAPTVIEAEE